MQRFPVRTKIAGRQPAVLAGRADCCSRRDGRKTPGMAVRHGGASRPRQTGRVLLSVAGAAILAVCLIGCQEIATPEKLPTVVATQVVAIRPYAPQGILTGTIAARIESELAFRTTGQIAERFADVGDHVEKGAVLATIQTDEPQADLDAARAALRAAEATLKQAQTNFARQTTLLEGGYTTKSAFDAAQEALRTAESSLGTAKSDVGTAEEQLTYTTLRAEAPGIITARNAERGQVVSAAQSVFTLAEDGPRDAVFDINESAMAREPSGGEVEVRLVSDPSIKARGLVREIAPAFDVNTGTLRVKVGIENTPPAMTLGAVVSGVATFAAEEVVSLPWTALSAAKQAPSVWVVDPKTGTASQRPIVIDRYQTGRLLVRSGLKNGDIVVTAGVQLLRPGEPVSLAKEEAPRP